MKKLFTFLFILGFVASSMQSFGQIVAGEAFLQGNFIEAGVSTCGSFGTNNPPPAGYHPNSPLGGLGYVADVDQDGWNVGTPPFIGDYFLPGSPVEGFGLQFDGNLFLNGNDGTICGLTDIPGSVISFTTSATETCTEWQGTINNVQITIETCVPQNELYFVSTVTICNNSANTINDVFFLRHVDPDNEQTNSGSFTTENEILWQPSATECRALVGATGQDFGAFLGLGNINPNARVAFGGFSLNTITDLADVHNGIAPHVGTGSNIGDEAIDLTFNYDSIPVGDCQDFSFAYILDTADIDEALNAVGVTTVFADGIDITGTYEYGFCPLVADTVELSIVGGSDWTWTTTSGIFINGIDTGNTIQILTPGNAVVSATGIDAICGLTTLDIDLMPSIDRTADAGPPIVAQCDGDSVQLNGTSAGATTWSPPLGLSNPNVEDPMILLPPGASGWYVLNTSCGVDSTFVEVVPTFNLSITPTEDTICLGGSSILNTTTSPSSVNIADIDWSPGADLNDSTILSPLAIPQSTGDLTYVIEAVSDSGCVQSDSVNIHVAGTAPTVFITADQTGLVCPNTPLQLTAEASQLCPFIFDMFDSFGDGWNGAQMEFVQNGTVVATSTIPPGGSALTDTIQLFSGQPVSLNYTSGSFESEVSFSFEELDGTVLFADGPFPATGPGVFTFTPDCGGGAGFTYTWSPSGAFDMIMDSVAVITPSGPTTITVDADNGTCFGTGQYDILVDVPRFEATPDTNVCLGDIVQLGVNQILPLGNCEYTLDMDDSFGDGWNGAEIEVFVNGTSIGTFSATGSGSNETFTAPGDATIELVYSPGTFENEVSYSLIDESNTVLFSDGPNPATGSVFTTVSDCPVSLTSTEVCEYTLDMDDSFGDGWNGGNLNVTVDGSSVGIFAAAGTGSTATFSASPGQTIELTYTPGAFENENSYSLIAPDGSVLFSDGPNPATGIVFTTTATTGSCVVVPPDVTFQWSPSGEVLPFDTIPDPIASPNLPTDYILTFTQTATGCTFTDTATVLLGDFPYTLNDTVICTLGESVELNLTGNPDVVTWTADPTLSATNIPNPIATPDTDPKVYYVNFVKNGCGVNDSVVVSTLGAAIVDATPDVIDLCIGGDTTLFVEPGFTNYEWQLPDGTTTPGTEVTVDDAGFYFYTLTRSGCDTRSDSIEVRLFRERIDANPDTVAFCAGSSATLNVESGFSNPQWNLPDGSTFAGDTVNASITGPFFYTVENNEGCILLSDSIIVEVNDSLVFDPNIANGICCTDDSIVINDLRNIVAGNPSGLTATLNGNTVTTPIVLTSGGTYSWVLTDDNGCSTVGDFDVIQICLDPMIDTTGASPWFVGDEEMVSVSHNDEGNNHTYDWTTDNGTYDNSGIESPMFTPANTGPATLSVQVGASAALLDGSTLNCVEDASITINVDDVPPLPTVPAAFSPNGDGLNDVFVVGLSPSTSISRFRIYNRWGELVYDSPEPTGWDGTTNGNVQPIGTYTYRLEIVQPDGEVVGYTGTVSLIR